MSRPTSLEVNKFLRFREYLDEQLPPSARPAQGADVHGRHSSGNLSHDDFAIDIKNILVQEDGTISVPFAVLVFGLVCVTSGRWFLGFTMAAVGLVLAACNSAQWQIREEDKQDIRYNIMDADDIVQELASWASAVVCVNACSYQSAVVHRARIHCVTGLEALARKYGRHQQQQQSTASKEQQETGPNRNDATVPATTTTNSSIRISSDHHLELFCQEAAYIAYRIFPGTDDQVVSAALSLHAVVAKDPLVRQRHLSEADRYGLDLPVQCMREALHRAKKETNEDTELQCAELQRKACLLLGALGDGGADIATNIVEEGGLEIVLAALNWFRCHSEVANWALWAVFILSYDNAPNKNRNVELGGVPVIIQAIRYVPDCVDVARHGIAILFDLMKDDNHQSDDGGESLHKHFDVWTVRKSALATGLHPAILQTMDRFSGTLDIMMMGHGLLAGTDYTGHVPQYQPKSEDIAE